MPKDMILFARTFDLLEWLLPKSEKFPRTFRNTLTQRLMNCALDFQEALFDALSQGGSTRQRHLREADASLNKLRLYLRLIYRWGWISSGQYAHVSRLVKEIGKLLGGWIKVA